MMSIHSRGFQEKKGRQKRPFFPYPVNKLAIVAANSSPITSQGGIFSCESTYPNVNRHLTLRLRQPLSIPCVKQTMLHSLHITKCYSLYKIWFTNPGDLARPFHGSHCSAGTGRSFHFRPRVPSDRGANRAAAWAVAVRQAMPHVRRLTPIEIYVPGIRARITCAAPTSTIRRAKNGRRCCNAPRLDILRGGYMVGIASLPVNQSRVHFPPPGRSWPDAPGRCSRHCVPVGVRGVKQYWKRGHAARAGLHAPVHRLLPACAWLPVRSAGRNLKTVGLEFLYFAAIRWWPGKGCSVGREARTRWRDGFRGALYGGARR